MQPVAGEPGYYSAVAGRLAKMNPTLAGSAAGMGINQDIVDATRAASLVPESVDKYQAQIEAKRLPSAPYDAKTAAMLVPKEVDEYQAKIEAPRVLPGRSMGEPIEAGTSAKPAETPSKSKVAQLLAAIKAEDTSAKGKPNIADIIEAASAGWGGRKASYLEKQATEAERAAEIEDLAKRAQLEEALQESQFAHDVELAKLKLGGMAAPSLAGLTPGQALGAKFMSGIGGQ